MGDKMQQLGDLLKQLKGRIPAPDMPPGAAGDDDEDEDQPLGPKPGQEEGPTKEGQEMTLSPEQAGWLLEAVSGSTANGRLPMGGRSRRTQGPIPAYLVKLHELSNLQHPTSNIQWLPSARWLDAGLRPLLCPFSWQESSRYRPALPTRKPTGPSRR